MNQTFTTLASAYSKEGGDNIRAIERNELVKVTDYTKNMS
jgi:hypothetical protein